jgi:hypothetical protein
MPGDWKGPFSRKLQVRASERGRRMANRRWQLDRERRNKLAQLTAEQFPVEIRRRLIVIDDEIRVRETTFWSFDSAREWRRKERTALRGFAL